MGYYYVSDIIISRNFFFCFTTNVTVPIKTSYNTIHLIRSISFWLWRTKVNTHLRFYQLNHLRLIFPLTVLDTPAHSSSTINTSHLFTYWIPSDYVVLLTLIIMTINTYFKRFFHLKFTRLVCVCFTAGTLHYLYN